MNKLYLLIELLKITLDYLNKKKMEDKIKMATTTTNKLTQTFLEKITDEVIQKQYGIK